MIPGLLQQAPRDFYSIIRNCWNYWVEEVLHKKSIKDIKKILPDIEEGELGFKSLFEALKAICQDVEIQNIEEWTEFKFTRRIYLIKKYIDCQNRENLYNNYLKNTQIPKEESARSIKVLSERGGQIWVSSLPPEIGLFTNLEELTFYGRSFIFLPSEMGKLKNLKQLDLRSNKLLFLPAEIGELSNLKILKLEYNQLKSLPPQIGKLTNLQELLLGKNQLISLPEEMGQLTSLEKLDLSNNQLHRLPNEILKMTNLKYLELKSNHIECLPPEIGGLIHLLHLNVRSNRLFMLPLAITNIALLTLHIEADKIQEADMRFFCESGLKIVYDSWM